MNDLLDLHLEVVSLVSRSCQPLCDIQRWISRKPLEIVLVPVGYPSDSLASCFVCFHDVDLNWTMH